jgi:hypothetical protein
MALRQDQPAQPDGDPHEHLKLIFFAPRAVALDRMQRLEHHRFVVRRDSHRDSGLDADPSRSVVAPDQPASRNAISGGST